MTNLSGCPVSFSSPLSRKLAYPSSRGVSLTGGEKGRAKLPPKPREVWGPFMDPSRIWLFCDEFYMTKN